MNKKAIISISISLLLIVGLIYILITKNNPSNIDKVSEEFFVEKEISQAGDDLLSDQVSIDKEIEEYTVDKQYTFNNPKIIINPYKISPLTALIIFTSSKEDTIKVEINGEYVTTMEKSKNHRIPIYGLLAGKTNKVKLTSSNGDTKTFDIKTDSFGGDLLEVEESSSKLNDDLYFVSGITNTMAKAYDKEGNIRWYLTTIYSHDLEFLDNGHILLSNGELGNKSATYSGLVEVDYLGKVYKYYNLTGGYHHETIETNDSIIVASSNPETTRVGDYIVEIDKDNAKEKRVLDLHEVVSKISPTWAKSLSNEWAWNNAIYYLEESDDLILSLRGMNAVMNINFETKKINWIFGDPKFWPSEFSKYFLNVTDNSRYPLGQHSVFMTEDGQLGLFNNDYNVQDEFKIGPELSNYANNYSSAVIYDIEGNNIKTNWEYTGNKEYFSFAISNFSILNNNNKLINFGWEFTEEAYKNNISFREYIGVTYAKIIELDENDNVVFSGKINNGQYRVYKNVLYKEKTNNVDYDKYQAIDNNEKSEMQIVKTKDYKESLQGAEISNDSITISKSSIKLDAFIQDTDIINILFVSEKEDTYIFNYKSYDEIARPSVNIDLTGQYALYLEINGKYYNTQKVIEF